MKNVWIWVIGVIALVLVIGFVGNITGNVSLFQWLTNVFGSSCSDSDGGINYDVFGTVTASRKSYPDSCLSNTALKEGYCSKNKYAAQNYNCPYGCLNGVCQPQPQPSNQTNVTQPPTNQTQPPSNQTNTTT